MVEAQSTRAKPILINLTSPSVACRQRATISRKKIVTRAIAPHRILVGAKISTVLFHVSTNYVDQLLSSLGLSRSWLVVRVNNMKADVTLNNLHHQATHRAAACCNGLKNGGRILFFIQHLLDSFDLSANAADAVKKLFLVPDGVGHIFFLPVVLVMRPLHNIPLYSIYPSSQRADCALIICGRGH